jgi:hypothetical protein
MILLISLRVKIGVQMGIELNYYKRFVSVSDAIKKNSVHLPFIHFTPQNLLDTITPSFRVPVFTIKIKEDKGSKTILINYYT